MPARPGLRRPPVNPDSRQAQGLALWLPSGLHDQGIGLSRPTTIGSGVSMSADAQFGTVRAFDGTSNGFLSYAAPSLHLAGKTFNATLGYSVCAWIKTGSSVTSAVLAAVSWNGGFLTASALGHNASGQIGYSQTGTDIVTTGTTASTQTWYHVAYVYNGPAGAHTLYVNGRQVGTSASGPHTAAISGFDVGRYTDTVSPSAFWTGLIGDVRFYLRALSAPEIYQLWDPLTRWELYRPRRLRYAGVLPTQKARPDADTALGSWTDQAGGTTNIYTTIDEVTASDADYIRSSQSPASADIYQASLSSLNDPQSSSGHIVRYRYAKDVAAGDRIDLTVRLKQGSTEIASWTHTNISSTLTTAQQTLTGTQADAITDYSNLDLWFEAVKV